MASSEIEWTESTWNPVAGCAMVSPGCTNCYAMRLAARLEAMGSAKYRGTTRRSGERAVWSGRLNMDEGALSAPLSWARPQRIFVNSMSDLFHENVPLVFIRKVWSIMMRADWHTFQILTKRPGHMRDVLTRGGFRRMYGLARRWKAQNTVGAWMTCGKHQRGFGSYRLSL